MTSCSTPDEATDHRLATDADELMYRAEAAQIGMVLNLDVAAQSRVVGHDHAVADLTVVRDVDRRHEQAVVTDPGHAAASGRARMHRHMLADLVVATDHQLGRFAAILEVLRPMAETGEREDPTAVAQGGPAGHDDVGFQPRRAHPGGRLPPTTQ